MKIKHNEMKWVVKFVQIFNPPHPLPNHLHLKVQNSSSFSKHEFLDLSLISKD